MYLIYNVCLYAYFLLAGPYYLLHILLREHYRAGLFQRLGFVPRNLGTHSRFEKLNRGMSPNFVGTMRVWFHGVSVGEIQTLMELGEKLRKVSSTGSGQALPALSLVYSTTTLTAQRIAANRMPQGSHLIYYPLDLPFAVSRALDRVRPSLVVLAETELWPNFIRQCHARNIPVVLANGRISDRSFRGYRLLRFFTRVFLPWIDLFLMQNSVGAQRIIALGAPPERVLVTGNMKADTDTVLGDAPADLQTLCAQLRVPKDALVLVAGSTHPGEESAVAELYRRLRKEFPGLVLVVAPRHLDRVQAIEQELKALGLTCMRRSRANGSHFDVLLLDTLGELPWVYQWADIVFIGKSLRSQGGQNPLEAARLSRPVLFGPHMENFSKEAAELLRTGGAMQIADEQSLERAVAQLLGNPERLREMGRHARQTVLNLRGAIGKNAEILQKKLSALPL